MRPPSGYALGRRLAPRVWAATAADGSGPPLVVKVPASPQQAHREVAARRTVRHPHLLPLVDAVDGTARGAAGALVLPRAAMSLHDRAARALLTPGELVTVGVTVAGALAALHREGLVHGDVHPGNVLLAADGTPLLADLDAAGPEGSAATRTPGFTAPEVGRGGLATARAEQWSLAATCAAVAPPTLPTPIAVVLAVAMATDPVDRFPDLPAFAAALAHAHPAAPVALAAPSPSTARRARRAAPPVTRRFGPRPPRPGPRRRAPGPLAIAALAAAALVAGAAIPRLLPGARPAHPPPCPTPSTTRPGDRLVDGTCPQAIQRGRTLLATVAGVEHRYQLGRDGDVFLLGDWSCRGEPTPGLYRPATGEAEEFDTWTPTAEGAAPTRVAQLEPNRTPTIARTDQGCDTITTS